MTTNNDSTSALTLTTDDSESKHDAEEEQEQEEEVSAATATNKDIATTSTDNFDQFRAILLHKLTALRSEVALHSQQCKQQIADRMALNLDIRRPLHWVLKIGNLKQSLEFFSKVFTMRVLRHEEFDSGCEAQCNGDYNQPWSKTMIGYGPELEHFSLELTYNYGVSEYRRGNDLKYIGLCVTPQGLQNCEDLGYPTESLSDAFTEIAGPDGVRYRCQVAKQLPAEPFWSIALNSTDIDRSFAYWCGTLQLYPLSYVKGKYLRAAYGKHTPLEFFPVKGDVLDFGRAQGRIAFTTSIERGPYVLQRYVESMEMLGRSQIHTMPVTLSTAGKADVDVIILQDVDGFEICFVGEDGFRDLSTTKAGDEVIDWEARANKGGDQPKGKSMQ